MVNQRKLPEIKKVKAVGRRALVMRLLFLIIQTLIKKFMVPKIFGLLNFMLHGADIAKHLNQSGKLLRQNLKDKLKLQRWIVMHRKIKESAEEWVYQDSQLSNTGTMVSVNPIKMLNHTMVKDNQKISLILQMI
jgi:hypothetical protein